MSHKPYDPERVFVRAAGFTEGIEWAFWLVLTVWWIVELNLGPLELVLLGTVLEASVLLAETPTGVVADLISRKRSLIIAQVLMGVGFIWAVASTNYWVILPAQAVFGIGWTFRSGADTAWVTDELKGMGEHSDGDLDRLLIRKHRFGIAVALITLPVTVVVGELASVRWAGLALGIIQILMGGYFYVVMREDHFVPGHVTNRGFFETLREGIAAVRGTPRLRMLVLVVVALDMGSEGFDRLGYKHLLDSGSIDDGSLLVLGALFIALAFAGLVVNAVAGRVLESGYGVARLAVVLLAVAAIGGALASVTSIVGVIAIGYMMQDSTREALGPVLDGWANRDAPAQVRATVHSL
ncbi:MAG: hypothetical protein GWP47_04630, partial [Actinobacteria bacterium]|nr:hypothetical protein [Actinomycetota bacterium]